MAKRFIDTGIFRKPSIRAMKAPYKALFIYLLCECDHAGVWEEEIDVAAMRLGMELDKETALKELGASVKAVGSKWYLTDFVAYQYGELNPANRVHASVISRLQSIGINPSEKHENKPLASPLEGAKDKDKDKEKDNQEGKGTRAKAEPELTWPQWAGPKCRAAWAEFIEYRQREKGERYRTRKTEQRALNLVCKYFPDGPSFVGALEHTMARTWVFPVNPAEHKYPRPEGAPEPVWNPRA